MHCQQSDCQSEAARKRPRERLKGENHFIRGASVKDLFVQA